MTPCKPRHTRKMMRSILVTVALLMSASPVLAQFQVPGECTELAAREGFPADTLTRLQAARARIRMVRLSDRDPLVKQCRAAISRPSPSGSRWRNRRGHLHPECLRYPNRPLVIRSFTGEAMGSSQVQIELKLGG